MKRKSRKSRETMLYGGHHVVVAACVHGKPIPHLCPSDKCEQEGDFALIYGNETALAATGRNAVSQGAAQESFPNCLAGTSVNAILNVGKQGQC